ncbi:MAG: hypothetical protein ACQCN4_06015 [Candidatus Bathyarchaeia archaeon]
MKAVFQKVQLAVIGALAARNTALKSLWTAKHAEGDECSKSTYPKILQP